MGTPVAECGCPPAGLFPAVTAPKTQQRIEVYQRCGRHPLQIVHNFKDIYWNLSLFSEGSAIFSGTSHISPSDIQNIYKTLVTSAKWELLQEIDPTVMWFANDDVILLKTLQCIDLCLKSSYWAIIYFVILFLITCEMIRHYYRYL